MGKTTHFNLRRDEWDDVQKAYQIIFFLVCGLCWKRFRKEWFMYKTWEENESKSESGNSIVFLLFPFFFKSVGYGLRIKPFLFAQIFIYLIFKGDFYSSIFLVYRGKWKCVCLGLVGFFHFLGKFSFNVFLNCVFDVNKKIIKLLVYH